MARSCGPGRRGYASTAVQNRPPPLRGRPIYVGRRETIMKIMLQDLRNKLFFRYGGVWTSAPEVAYDFQTAQAVFEFVEREALRDVQLVVKFENPERYEVVSLDWSPASDPTLSHARQDLIDPRTRLRA